MGINPLLANALDLDGWADTRESQGAFPELMRRLLAQTPGITNINIRAREGIAAPGWDGTATSDGSAFLPKGELRFEFGTDKRTKAKANKDYNTRAKDVTGKSDEIFVFATPRNWAGAAGWAKERRQEGVFASVEAYDAHRLVGWLQSTPAVHYWISEQMGKPVSGAQTLTSWWEQLRRNCKIEVPPEFHTAGRDNESEALMQLLSREGTVSTVQAAWCNDAIAFCFAVLKENDYARLERTLLVFDRQSWNQLAIQPSSLNLIPVFDDPDIGLALKNGHSVVKVIDNVGYSREKNRCIRLGKVGRAEARNMLRRMKPGVRQADEWAALARRSMNAFYRNIALDAQRKSPKWVSNNEIAETLAPLVLVGEWEDGNQQDWREIEGFIGTDSKQIKKLLNQARAVSPDDPPFVQAAGRWSVVDAIDAAKLLLPHISEQCISRWKKYVMSVIGLNAGFETRGENCAQEVCLDGNAKRVSDGMLRRVCHGLILAINLSDDDDYGMWRVGEFARKIVQQLLDCAFRGSNERSLLLVSYHLPLLAEADPNEFLKVLRSSIGNSDSVVMKQLMSQCGQSIVNSGFRSNLIYSIELLCGLKSHYVQSAKLLAIIADKVIAQSSILNGQALLDGYIKVVASWSRYSRIDVKCRVAVVKWVFGNCPALAWESLSSALSCDIGIHLVISESIYCDLDTDDGVIGANDSDEHLGDAYIEAVVDVAISYAGSNFDRCCVLLKLVGLLNSSVNIKVSELMLNLVENNSWGPDELVKNWVSFRDLFEGHLLDMYQRERVSDDEMKILLEAINLLEPTEDPRRYAYLFNHRIHEIGGIWSGPVQVVAPSDLDRNRRDAVCEIVSEGIEEVRFVGEIVPYSQPFGLCLARTQCVEGVLMPQLVKWFGAESASIREVAAAYVHEKALCGDVTWVIDILNSPLYGEVVRARFIAALPVRKEIWDAVCLCDESSNSFYWQHFNVYYVNCDDRGIVVDRLLDLRLWYRAIVLLLLMVHEADDCIDSPGVAAMSAGEIYSGHRSLVDQVVRALSGLVSTDSYSPSVASEFRVDSLLKWLDAQNCDIGSVALIQLALDVSDCRSCSSTLYSYLSLHYDKFIELVVGTCQNCSCPNRPNSVSGHARYDNVVLNWKQLPGLRKDCSLDENKLKEWVAGCVSEIEVRGLCNRALEAVGGVLACSPAGVDGIWPNEEVRKILEDCDSDSLVKGMRDAYVIRHSRSIKLLYEGGDVERLQFKRFSKDAQQLVVDAPVTAGLLCNLARYYKDEARAADDEAEELADRG